MNIETNLGMSSPLNLGNPVKSKDILLGLQSVSPISSHESGESEFQKIISYAIAEQSLHMSVDIEREEELVDGIRGDIEEFAELCIGDDISTNFLFVDGHIVYGLKSLEPKLEKAVKSQGSIKEIVMVKVEGDQIEHNIPSQVDQTKWLQANIGNAEISIDLQGSQMVGEEIEIERNATERLISKDETVKLYQSETDILNPLHSASIAGGTTEWTPVNQTAEKSEPCYQISEMILSKLEQKGPTEFKMLLEPGTLGEIDIKLKIDKGKLTIDILAANAKTQALLTSQVDKLITSIGLRNVQVESIQISQPMPQNHDDQSQDYIMDSTMDAFQKKHQEQHRQRSFFHEGKQGDSFGQLQTDASGHKDVNIIGTRPYDSHRINYKI